MDDKLMYILNHNTQNYPFCELNLVVETIAMNDQSKFTKVTKVIKPTYNKSLIKNFGD